MKVAMAGDQQDMFDFGIVPSKPIGSPGAMRAHSGNIGEAIVCELLDLTPIPVSSQYDACMDAQGHGYLWEVKVLRGGNGKAVIYKWRLEKDRQVEEETGRRVLYAFGQHNLPRGLTDVRQVWEAHAKGLRSILVMTREMLAGMVGKYPLNAPPIPAVATAGYHREGYEDGYYNVPIKDLRNREHIKKHRCVVGEINGLPLAANVFYPTSVVLRRKRR